MLILQNIQKKYGATAILNIDKLELPQGIYWLKGANGSGMLKKLSLMLGFMGQPKLIVLDEPLITIDVAAVQNMIKLIHEYHQKGSLILLSSHQNFDNQSDILISKTLLVHHQTVEFAL